ncbi:MAG TPA: hypothetical protein VH082_02855 [Rudaea sp.]|jgi:hypothetical protein|nr:hypothetical protein [Rudaea sp.]
MNDHAPAPTETLAPINERWAKVFRYAIDPAALSTILAIAMSHAVVSLLPLLGMLLDLVVWAAFFKYCFEALRWTANGREKPPEISFTVSDQIANYAVLLLIFVELLILFIGIFYGAYAALALGVALMLAMPAMVTILALEEGMTRALNPLAWLMLMSRLGNQYFILTGFFCAAIVAQSLLGIGLRLALPGFVAEFITYCVVNYFMLTTFHLIGNVIYTNRETLGYTGHVELNDEVPYTDPSRKVLDIARARAADGDAAGAAALLRDELATYPDQLPLHDEYRHWLRQSDQKTDLVAHAKKYIPILIAKGHDRRAMEVVRECQTIDPSFTLDNADDITRLAHAAAEGGQTQLALGLIAGFHKRFRNHPDIARNYLLAAKLWAERMNKEMQARAMLQQIKLTLPNDPVIPQVDAYIAFLDKIAQTPPKPPE